MSGEAWDRYTRRVPSVGRALLNDPLYAAQMSLIRQWLDLTDMVLEDNGIGHDVRRQVMNQLLYGSPNPYDAEARIELNHEKVEKLMREVQPRLLRGGEEL